jgi:hypothetical protein
MSLEELKVLAEKYNDRIAPLFKIGRKGLLVNEAIDYIEEFGFTQNDIPELLNLAEDDDIFHFDYSDMDDGEGLEFYGVVHAWYALSQLKAPAAKELFVHLMENQTNSFSDDWIISGFRDLIKPYRQEMASYFIEAVLSEQQDQWVRVEYLEVLQDMTKASEIDLSIIDTLIETVLKNSKNEIVITMAISACVKLKLIHHYDLIVQCFENEIVDLDHMGDLEDIEIALGLKTKREYPRKLTEMQKVFAAFHRNNESETYIREDPKIGRNDPCPCGSGKKYKKCCQNKQ